MLAAGHSRRFGKCKLSHPLSTGRTVFAQTYNNIKLAGASKICVVTQTGSKILDGLKAESPNLLSMTIMNSSGLGQSIARGVAQTADWPGWIICLADMPAIPAGEYAQIKNLSHKHAIVRPFYKGQPGHPVYLSHKFFTQLTRLGEDKGASSILTEYAEDVFQFQSTEPGIVMDVDTPDKLSEINRYLQLASPQGSARAD